MSISTPSDYSAAAGNVYQPVQCVASTGSYLTTNSGLGIFLGFQAFNAGGAAATFRFHDGVASSTVAAITPLISVAASTTGALQWYGPQGVMVASGVYLERVAGTTEIVFYGQ